jgi:hypothetical protein
MLVIEDQDADVEDSGAEGEVDEGTEIPNVKGTERNGPETRASESAGDLPSRGARDAAPIAGTILAARSPGETAETTRGKLIIGIPDQAGEITTQ